MDKKIILAEAQNFETERLILRKIELEDASNMFAYHSDPEVMRYMNMKRHENLEATQQAIVDFYMTNRLNVWGIEEKNTKKIIGDIYLALKGDKGTFAWLLNSRYWGLGIMPEAASCLRDFAFDKLALQVITADHLVENTKSGRVMEKIGMKKTGQIYEYFKKEKRSVALNYWAITRSDYEKQKAR